MTSLWFPVSQTLYLRDPLSSLLGRRILMESVRLIDELGFEHFTFKKLADAINSTEASVYRYFENKHRLLLYLIDWYWLWLDYRFSIVIQNLVNPAERLKACLRVLLSEELPGIYSEGLDPKALKRLVMAEFEKTYLTKQVDRDNKEGVFIPYKAVCKKLAAMVLEINPKFPFPHTLMNTVLLSATHQLFYAEHLPSLTDIKFNPHHHDRQLEEFLKLLIFKTIEP
ncbi:MAG: TetR/AcrR family transcriptional regulator [Cyclobacteriaceae bacterium]|nr:TetR/AcrR family transcriptional regulator [Cyclobacteriaceae bacterium]MCX7637417.1 TetR/AcrR family transcriptional regulator [Cyclobacteriaceae bacterium]MDW8330683.1 TetR/AcrR family transcriptional regulator [Cyclobacteriaceae bacterium]